MLAILFSQFAHRSCVCSLICFRQFLGILFYQYKDKKTLEMMIRKGAGQQRYSQATNRKIDQLYTCLRYCEDSFECRRTLQLRFFGEVFDKSKCNKTCDNW